jgi:FixJ family two-component response regulator
MLLLSGGYIVESFENTNDFFASDNADGSGFILIDIFLKGESGLDLQDSLKDRFSNLSIVYITGHGDVPMTVWARKNEAFKFLEKPINDKQLFQAVDKATNFSRSLLKKQQEKTS